MKYSKKLLKVALPILAMSMMLATPAHAETIFDRIKAITTNLPVIKEAAIYIFFLIGLCGIGWAGMEMFKKSKGRDGGDTSWSSIGIKFLAGAVLVGLTVTTDTMTQTFVGTSASTSTTNIQ